jgi:adenine specific DNA methylase Mod
MKWYLENRDRFMQERKEVTPDIQKFVYAESKQVILDKQELGYSENEVILNKGKRDCTQRTDMIIYKPNLG